MMTHDLTIGRPKRDEAAEYYFKYIDRVATDDIVRVLGTQQDETIAFMLRISEEESLHRYAPDKWTIRQVLSHLNDTERVFAFRALWFARGFDTPLPSFDQNVSAVAADANSRSWTSHLEEFRAIRQATLTLFRNLPPDAWMRRGVASENPFTTRALAYIIAGHVAHHTAILEERYLQRAR